MATAVQGRLFEQLPHDPSTDQKLRGGYYTPDQIGSVLAKWAIASPSDRVLEPSAGDGNLVCWAERELDTLGSVTALEYYDREAAKIEVRADPRITSVVRGDFFTWFDEVGAPSSFDAVIGNPPFIRYQHFAEEVRGKAFELMAREGLHPTRLTNAWLPFVVVSTMALREGGRLAMVLPAELLQVGYASELREYLAKSYSKVTIVTFRELVFDGILQETVLLLGIKGFTDDARIAFVELDKLSDLSLDVITNAPGVATDLDHAREKWTQYYLSPDELRLIRAIESHEQFSSLGAFAEIDVGVVTGRNQFFVLSPTQARELALEAYCLPLVGRSSQTLGIALKPNDWDELVARDTKCYLLQLGNVSKHQLPQEAQAYVSNGEADGIHLGYKCRIRMPNWWRIPGTWIPDAFMLRQIYDGPRIIVNRVGATSTDTIHRVRAGSGVAVEWLAAMSLNSLTHAFSEIKGRSYGGGVLELEPSEAESLPVAAPPEVDTPIGELDRLSRRGDLCGAMDLADKLTLRNTDLSTCDLRQLRDIWMKLSQRRLARSRRS